MLNLTTSFVQTMLNVVIGLLSFLKGPVLLVAGVAFTVFLLVSPAEAAVIQCNASGCPLVSWWDLLPWTKKAGIFLFFSGLIIGNIIMWHDRKVTVERIKKEEEEWLKKYHS